MPSKIEMFVNEEEQKQGKLADAQVICRHCGISGKLTEVLIRDEHNKAVIRCKECGSGEQFQFVETAYFPELGFGDKLRYSKNEIINYVLLKEELSREIKDERIVNVLASIAAKTFGRSGLSYFSDPKRFEIRQGTLSGDLCSIYAEAPFEPMVALVDDALKNGSSMISIITNLQGNADNSLYRDIQTLEHTGDASIYLSFENDEPVLRLSAPEFYEELSKL